MSLPSNLSLLFEIKGDSSGAEASLRSFAGAAKGAEGQLGGMSGIMGKVTSALGAAGPAAAIAAQTIGAVASAAAAAGGALFALAKEASDYGSEIFDASQKTGLTAETLSSLKFAAEQSGSSLDALTGGFAKFAKLVAEAGDGSKEAAAKLKQFGVDPKEAVQDLDAALTKVFARIAAMPPGVLQMKAAMDAFGKSGADLLPTILSFNGDLDALKKRAAELGISLTDEAAKASDEFGDSLDLLSKQASGIARTFAFEFMPALTEAMGEVSSAFTSNKTEVRWWGEVVGNWIRSTTREIRLLIAVTKDWYEFVNTGVLTTINSSATIVEIKAEQEQRRKDAAESDQKAEKEKEERRQKALAAARQADEREEKERAEAERKRREEANKKQLADLKQWNQIQLKEASDNYDAYERQVKDQLDSGEITIGQYKALLLEASSAFQQALAGIVYNDFLLKKQGKTGQELRNLEAEYAQSGRRILEEAAQREASINAVVSAASKRRVADAELENQRLGEVGREATQARIMELEDLFYAREIGEIEFRQKVGQLKLQLIEDEKDRLKEILRSKDIEKEKREEIEHRLKILNWQGAQQSIENARIVTRAWQDSLDTIRKVLEAGPPAMAQAGKRDTSDPEGVSLDYGMGGTGGGFLESLGLDPTKTRDDLDILGDAFKKLGGMAGDAFKQMAQGVGSMIEQWVLYGEVGPDALRKMTAAVLANLASQAAVEALMELARGIAALANPFTAWQAPFHFKAAAVFGAVAAVSAVAGRAIAGNAFKNQSAASTGSSASGGSSGSRGATGGAYSGQPDGAVSISRGAPAIAMPRAEIVIRDRSGMFGKLFETEIRNNSGVRRLIIDTANA